MYCSFCGVKLSPGARFCSSCGAHTPIYHPGIVQHEAEGSSSSQVPSTAYGASNAVASVPNNNLVPPAPPYHTPPSYNTPPPLDIPSSISLPGQPHLNSRTEAGSHAGMKEPIIARCVSALRKSLEKLDAIAPISSRQKQRPGKIIGIALVILVVLGSIGIGLWFLPKAGQRAASTQPIQPANPQQLYDQIMHETPIMSDPMTTSDNFGWDHYSDQYGSCDFQGGTYHLKAQPGNSEYCYANATNFSDFVLQAQMKAISVHAGGLIFRGNPFTYSEYEFRIGTGGTYLLRKEFYDPDGELNEKTLLSGFSPAIQIGLNHPNQWAVLAQRDYIAVYVNNRYIGSTHDSSYQSGQIGMFTEIEAKTETEAVFSNVKVWKLGVPQVDLQQMYNQATSKSPMMNDALTSPGSTFGWDQTSQQYWSCSFQGRTYHATAQPGAVSSGNGSYHAAPQSSVSSGNGSYCYAEKTTFNNFVLQVQMVIINGHSGGILFRADNNSGTDYEFRMSTDGTYLLNKYYKDHLGDLVARTLFSGSTSAILTGSNRSNVIAVLVQGNTIAAYVNKQFVDSASDSAYQTGKIGVYADTDAGGSEVAFSNVQVWKL